MVGKQGGFSLIELITVVVLTSIIFVYVGSNQSQRGLEIQATRDDIVAALFYTQQIAMARQKTSNLVRFISDGVSLIDVQENAASIAGDNYPLTLPPGYSLTGTTLAYDKLGRTTATVLALNGSGGSVNITIESSGYAH